MSKLVPIGGPNNFPDEYRPGWNNGDGGNEGGYPETVTDAPGLSEYVAIARRHLLLVFGAIIACVGVSVYLVMKAAPLYRSAASVRLADTRRALTGAAEGPATEILSRETDVLQSQLQVLMSRKVLTDGVDFGGLQLRPSNFAYAPVELTNVLVAPDAAKDSLHLTFGAERVEASSGSEKAAAMYGQPLQVRGVALTVPSRPKVATASYKVISREDAIGDLRANFKPYARPKTDIIDLTYVGRDPAFAQRAANAMAMTFQTHNASTAQQASRRRRIFLEQQMAQTNGMLQRAMNDYSSFRSKQQVFNSKEKANAQEQGMVTVEMRRADLDAQRRTIQTLLGQAQRNRAAGDPNLRALVSSPGVAGNPVVQQLYAQLSGYEITLDSLTSSGAAQTNPDVVVINRLISSTNGKLIAAIRNQVSALDAQIASLDNLKTRSAAQISSAPATETEEAQLGQQVQAMQKISDQLQEEYQKAKMSEAVEVGQVEIMDLAELPSSPIPAGRVRKVALGLVLGVLLGLGLAVLVDGMNTSIRRKGDLETALQIPGLAIIPGFQSGNPLARRAPKLLKSANSRGSGGGRPDRAEGLVTVTDPSSSSAEAFRTLRTNLIFSQAVKALRSIVVTSASPGEGKTTTAANLAVTFAQQGMRVLIIDCDLRRARLHKVFGVQREPGLTDFLVGKLTIDEAALQTSVPGLYVLSSGGLPPNPAELLGGQRMKEALIELNGAFDLLIIDSPPLLAASDAAILSTMVDGVILVVRAGSTQTDAAQQASQQLNAVGARVVGAVLNDPDAKLAQYGGYYKYEYSTVEN